MSDMCLACASEPPIELTTTTTASGEKNLALTNPSVTVSVLKLKIAYNFWLICPSILTLITLLSRPVSKLAMILWYV